MITTIISIALVAAVAGAYAHGHASGIRQVYAEAEALAAARRRAPGETP